MKNYMMVCILVCVMAVLTNCSKVDVTADRATFDKEYAAWQAQNLRQYDFTYEFFNDAGPVVPVRMRVDGDSAYMIESHNCKDSVYEYFCRRDSMEFRNFTINNVYENLRYTFEENVKKVEDGTYTGFKIQAVAFTIKYDKQYHYPTEADLTTSYVEQVDGGAYYTMKITDFVVQEK